MPGLSFLFKKRFHPVRYDNQKKLFIAEQKQAEKNEKETESAKEVMKEKEMQHYESIGSMDFRDPRTAALKFMYSAPQSKGQEGSKNSNKQMASVKDYEAKIDEKTGDDEMVKAFRAKLVQTKLKSLGDLSAQQDQAAAYDVAEPYEPEQPGDAKSSSRPKGAPPISALEKEVGKRRTQLTHEEMGERFAVLKNAPMEGGYAKGMAVKHQPFSELLRNVHCARCGEWGHMSGERECPLRDYNPNDYARQQREDPMRRMLDAPSVDGGHSGGSGGGHYRNSSSGAGGSGSVPKRCTFVDEAGESDPEAEFLSTLTRREKKLLLRRLQVSTVCGVVLLWRAFYKRNTFVSWRSGAGFA